MKLISIYLLITVLVLSCRHDAEQFQQNYDTHSDTIDDPNVRDQMDTLFRGGRTFPSASDMVAATRVGDIPENNCPPGSGLGQRPPTPPRDIPSGDDVTNQNVCRHYERFKNSGVDEKALKQALTFYGRNQGQFQNPWISIADYTLPSSQERFTMLNIETGEVRRHRVSHGSGSIINSASSTTNAGDTAHNGMLDRCTHDPAAVRRHNQLLDQYNRNTGRSRSLAHERVNMTRGGFFKTAEFYRSGSSWPAITSSPPTNGLRMDGLTPGVNDRARSQGVVMHGADYNPESGNMGRSWGCPAFHPSESADILQTINDGALFYSYVGERCAEDQAQVDQTIPGWQNTCS